MEEYQEADILWPESTQDPPRIFLNKQNYLHFASSQNDVRAALASLSSSSGSSCSESTCTQESDDFSCTEYQAEYELEEYNSYFFSAANLMEEKVGCDDEDWQEADVLWPEKESPRKDSDWGTPENCSLGDDYENPLMKREARKNVVSSSPIDVPKISKMNCSVHLL